MTEKLLNLKFYCQIWCLIRNIILAKIKSASQHFNELLIIYALLPNQVFFFIFLSFAFLFDLQREGVSASQLALVEIWYLKIVVNETDRIMKITLLMRKTTIILMFTFRWWGLGVEMILVFSLVVTTKRKLELIWWHPVSQIFFFSWVCQFRFKGAFCVLKMEFVLTENMVTFCLVVL